MIYILKIMGISYLNLKLLIS